MTLSERSDLRDRLKATLPPSVRGAVRAVRNRLLGLRRELNGQFSPRNLLIEPIRLRRAASRPDTFTSRSTLFHKRHLSEIAGTISRLRRSDRYLRHRLTEHEWIRAWEYGMLALNLPAPDGVRLLDIGPGPSTLPAYFARRGALVTAIDLPQPYSVPFHQLLRQLRRGRVSFVAGSMTCMPFPDASFDGVVSISTIEHLHHEIGRSVVRPTDVFFALTASTLAEMARVLKPGGLFYLTSDAYLPGKADSDTWWGTLHEGQVVGAYPLDLVGEIFLRPLAGLGVTLAGPIELAADLLMGDEQRANYRGRFISTFCLVGRKA